MKNLWILFCATVLLGINTAQAGMPAARALARAFLNPVRLNESAGTKSVHDILNVISKAEVETAFEMKLETLIEKDPLLANLAGNLARDAHPEHFAESGGDLHMLTKLFARASGEKEDPFLSDRLDDIARATEEEMAADSATLQRLNDSEPVTFNSSDQYLNRFFSDAVSESRELRINELERKLKLMRSDLKWQKYLSELP